MKSFHENAKEKNPLALFVARASIKLMHLLNMQPLEFIKRKLFNSSVWM